MSNSSQESDYLTYLMVARWIWIPLCLNTDPRDIKIITVDVPPTYYGHSGRWPMGWLRPNHNRKPGSKWADRICSRPKFAPYWITHCTGLSNRAPCLKKPGRGAELVAGSFFFFFFPRVVHECWRPLLTLLTWQVEHRCPNPLRPNPPSLGLTWEVVFAVELGADTRRRSSGREEEDEELLRRRQLQEEQLMKVCPLNDFAEAFGSADPCYGMMTVGEPPRWARGSPRPLAVR